jgi:hypothetical protein
MNWILSHEYGTLGGLGILYTPFVVVLWKYYTVLCSY